MSEFSDLIVGANPARDNEEMRQSSIRKDCVSRSLMPDMSLEDYISLMENQRADDIDKFVKLKPYRADMFIGHPEGKPIVKSVGIDEDTGEAYVETASMGYIHLDRKFDINADKYLDEYIIGGIAPFTGGAAVVERTKLEPKAAERSLGRLGELCPSVKENGSEYSL